MTNETFGPIWRTFLALSEMPLGVESDYSANRVEPEYRHLKTRPIGTIDVTNNDANAIDNSMPTIQTTFS